MARTQSSESTRGYFRRVFAENGNLLWERSNEQVLDRWMKDHNRQDVPPNIKTSMSNTKSEMRAEVRSGGGEAVRPRATRSGRGQGLEQLEVAIDNCLQFARQQESDDLLTIVKHLRRARNGVVVALDQPGGD